MGFPVYRSKIIVIRVVVRKQMLLKIYLNIVI